MKLYVTATFDHGYSRLPPHIQKQVDKKLAFFVEQGQGHRSLRFKVFQRYKEEGMYEVSITKNYRILLQKIKDAEYYLLRVGSHDILKKFKL